MTGLSDYTSKNLLNYLSGQTPEPTLPSVWLALDTLPGIDAGTGFTEVTGGSYARVQVTGPVTAGASFLINATSITLSAAVPAWVLALGVGAEVWDNTIVPPQVIATVAAGSAGSVLNITAANHASVGAADALTISAFSASTGSSPSLLTNIATITFAAATALWGTVVSFRLMDAVTSGNMLLWDFLGNFNWLPFENPTGGQTLTVKGNGYAANDPIVFTAEFGGTLPTLSTGTFTGYTINFVASTTTDTVLVDTNTPPTTPIVLTSSGSGMVRKITQQVIPSGVTASFGPSAFNVSGA